MEDYLIGHMNAHKTSVCSYILFASYSVILFLPVNPSKDLSPKENKYISEGRQTSGFEPSTYVHTGSSQYNEAKTEAGAATSKVTSETVTHHSTSVLSINRITTELNTTKRSSDDNLILNPTQYSSISISNFKTTAFPISTATDNLLWKESSSDRPTRVQTDTKLEIKSTPWRRKSGLNNKRTRFTEPIITPTTMRTSTSTNVTSSDSDITPSFLESKDTTEPSIKRRHVESNITRNATEKRIPEEANDSEDYYDDHEYNDYQRKDWNGNYENTGYDDDYYPYDESRAYNNEEQPQTFNYSEEWVKEHASDFGGRTFFISDIHLIPGRHQDTEIRRLSISLPVDDHMNTSLLVIYIWLGLLALMIAITFAVYRYKEQLNIIWWRVTHGCRPSPPQTQADEGLLEHPLV